jgi:hypothetical protein
MRKNQLLFSFVFLPKQMLMGISAIVLEKSGGSTISFGKITTFGESFKFGLILIESLFNGLGGVITPVVPYFIPTLRTFSSFSFSFFYLEKENQK